MKTHISQIVKIEDVEGKFGPQKKISFKDENDRMISGWIPAKDYDAKVWAVGRSPELEIVQNGKWWNFKLPSKKAQVAQASEDVLKGLREIFREIKNLEAKIDKLQAYVVQQDGIESFDEPREGAPF